MGANVVRNSVPTLNLIVYRFVGEGGSGAGHVWAYEGHVWAYEGHVWTYEGPFPGGLPLCVQIHGSGHRWSKEARPISHPIV